jgi:hypothetical protein
MQLATGFVRFLARHPSQTLCEATFAAVLSPLCGEVFNQLSFASRGSLIETTL